MPSIITHYKFCRDRVSYDLAKISLLGSQGPDPFFFHIGAIKKNSKMISKFGSLMHNIDPYIMYDYFIEYANQRSQREKDILYAFIKGFMYHYCVDRNCHPYVFYSTGFKTGDKESKVKFSVSHQMLETYIDVLLMKKYDIDIKPIDTILAPIEQIKLVSVMIYSFAKNVMHYEHITSSSYYDAVIGMQRSQKLLYSKHGVKKSIFKLLFRNTPINSLCMPKEVKNNDKLDILNENKNTWKEPSTGKERNESFFELLDNATKDADSVDKILLLASDNKKYKDELKDFTNEINHQGMHYKATRKYYSLIWNRLKK